MVCRDMEDFTLKMEQLLEEIPNETAAKNLTGLLGKIISRMPKAHRTDFSLNTISALMNHGTTGMSEEERKAFGEKIIKKLTN
ncbi:MAG TPA: hypothetical protein VIU33_07080 [Nitrospiria bacterium]